MSFLIITFIVGLLIKKTVYILLKWCSAYSVNNLHREFHVASVIIYDYETVAHLKLFLKLLHSIFIQTDGMVF